MKSIRIGQIAGLASMLVLSAAAQAGEKACAVVRPAQHLVVNCVSKSAAGSQALILGVDCSKKGDAECASAFPGGSIRIGTEVVEASGKRVVAGKVKGSESIRIFDVARLSAKHLKIRSDGYLVTETNQDVTYSSQPANMDYSKVSQTPYVITDSEVELLVNR